MKTKSVQPRAKKLKKVTNKGEIEKAKPNLILSTELQEEFLHFLNFVSPKHFSRSLRDAMLEISKGCETATPNYYAQLIDGLEMFFHILDLAEDEGKHFDKSLYER